MNRAFPFPRRCLLFCLALGVLSACDADESPTNVPPPSQLDAAVADVGLPDIDASPADSTPSADSAVDATADSDATAVPDAEAPLDAAPMEDGAIAADAALDAMSMAVDCPAWRDVASENLVSTLHQTLHDTYRPVTPAVERCGDACRYVAARLLMFTTVERFTDESGDFVVEGAYTGTRAPQPADADPDREQINCEHTWPRSRMAPEERDGRPTAMYSHQQADIHNLLPATPLANSTRGNFPFGEVVNAVNTLGPDVVLGEDADGNRVFQPRAERRGDVARVLFYYSIRWGGDIPAFEEVVLRRWSAADPPDDYERRRNDAIEQVQGNRNPFIDCPDLPGLIDDFQAFDILDTEASLGFP